MQELPRQEPYPEVVGTYEHDFCDGWHHEIVLEKIAGTRAECRVSPLHRRGQSLPTRRTWAGSGVMPSSSKRSATPKHENHGEMVEWIGGRFDPEKFSVDKVNKELGELHWGTIDHGRHQQAAPPEVDEAGTARRQGRPPKGWRPKSPAPDIPKLIAQGYDPVHAAYIFVHHITSVFSENVSRFPEMRTYAKEVGDAEEEYMPSGPPMSPLTTSYFTCWAFFDHRIGTTTDTLAGCLIEANDTICMNPHQLGALRLMSQSRMGIYEHLGTEGGHVWLRELITDRDFLCHSTSGYRGKTGELWYVRLFPPLEPELASYHIVFTTPYVLTGADEGRLDRLPETEHGGDQGTLRSGRPAPASQVRSRQELLERVRVPRLPSPSSGRHLLDRHPRPQSHAAPCVKRFPGSTTSCQSPGSPPTLFVSRPVRRSG